MILFIIIFNNWYYYVLEDDASLGPDRPHWYFRLIGCGYMGKNCDKGNSEMLFDELPFFQPRPEPTLYMVEPKEQKGIHCRFGMKGVIAGTCSLLFAFLGHFLVVWGCT